MLQEFFKIKKMTKEIEIKKHNEQNRNASRIKIEKLKNNMDLAQLKTLSTAELKRELETCLSITARNILYMAHIWHELKMRGETDLPLNSKLAEFLPLIHDNKLVPELVAQYAGQKVLLKKISNLPLKMQKSFLVATKVPFLKHENKKIEYFNLSQLNSRQILQIFKTNGIRNKKEQEKYIEGLAKRNKKDPSNYQMISSNNLRHDEETNSIIILKKYRINITELKIFLDYIE